jgi:hypothetical protein
LDLIDQSFCFLDLSVLIPNDAALNFYFSDKLFQQNLLANEWIDRRFLKQVIVNILYLSVLLFHYLLC